MKERLMAMVQSDVLPRAPLSATRTSAMWGTTLAAAAAVVFALVSVIQNFGLRSDLHDAQTRVATLQTRMAAERLVRAISQQDIDIGGLSARDFGDLNPARRVLDRKALA